MRHELQQNTPIKCLTLKTSWPYHNLFFGEAFLCWYRSIDRTCFCFCCFGFLVFILLSLSSLFLFHFFSFNSNYTISPSGFCSAASAGKFQFLIIADFQANEGRVGANANGKKKKYCESYHLGFDRWSGWIFVNPLRVCKLSRLHISSQSYTHFANK